LHAKMLSSRLSSMGLPPLPPRQLARPSFVAARKSTSSLEQTRRYNSRQFLDATRNYKTKGSGIRYSKRGPVLLQVAHQASRWLHQTNQLGPTTPVLFRNANRPSDFSLLSWSARLLSQASSRPLRMMASNNLNLPSQERRPSAVRQASVAPDNKTRSEVAKKQLRATQFSAMVSNSVNKTALHPGGVEYVAALMLARQY
jgi:hypothetical protein